MGLDRSPQRRPLDEFGEDDNFVATTLMDEYYARFAETWLGVPADGPPVRLCYPLQDEAAFSACDLAWDALRISAPLRLH
jgi:hypothetical protein